MASIAWFVQVVHYPLFGLVGSEAFGLYHEGHLRRTGWVVTAHDRLGRGWDPRVHARLVRTSWIRTAAWTARAALALAMAATIS